MSKWSTSSIDKECTTITATYLASLADGNVAAPNCPFDNSFWSHSSDQEAAEALATRQQKPCRIGVRRTPQSAWKELPTCFGGFKSSVGSGCKGFFFLNPKRLLRKLSLQPSVLHNTNPCQVACQVTTRLNPGEAAQFKENQGSKPPVASTWQSWGKNQYHCWTSQNWTTYR